MTTVGTKRRVTAAFAVAAGAALALTGCSAGQVSQMAVQVAAINGTEAEVGAMALRNIHVVYPDGKEYTNLKGGKAAVAFVVINTSERYTDKLEEITTDAGPAVIIADSTEIKPQALIVANAPKGETAKEATEDEAASRQTDALVELTSLSHDVGPGLTVAMTFRFEKAGDVLINVPVDAGPITPREESAKSGAAQEAAEGGH